MKKKAFIMLAALFISAISVSARQGYIDCANGKSYPVSAWSIADVIALGEALC